jgi:toxin-antitoxin system PIN domain toxin
VILLDANILLYAYDTSNPQHERARTWLERALTEEDDVRIALVTLLAFIRIASNPQVFVRPMRVDEAVGIVESWLGLSNVSVAEPTTSHWSALAEVARGGQVRGPQVMDAHLCALAIQSGATLCTTDKGFARFDGLKRLNPLG